MTNISKKINSVRYINAEKLWGSIEGLEANERARALMASGGVRFFDAGQFLIAEPTVSVVGFGGFPVVWSDETPQDQIELSVTMGAPFHPSAVAEAFSRMMGIAGFCTYLNPKNISALGMSKRMKDMHHFSSAHTVVINLLVLGASTAVENEFNCQRDLVHLSRLTEARTASQSLPPIVVLYPEFVDPFRKVYKEIVRILDEIPRSKVHCSRSDFLESRNIAFPAAKGTLFIISGTLRNLQKLALSLSDGGKEEEYKRIIAKMNNALAILFPDVFSPSSEQGYRFPDHFEDV